MSDTAVSTAIEGRVHGTPSEVWDVLARLFPIYASEQGHQWIKFEQDGATITFFGPRVAKEGVSA